MKLLENDFSYDVCPKTMTGQIKNFHNPLTIAYKKDSTSQ